MLKLNKNIFSLLLFLFLLSGISFHASAQNEWGENGDGNKKGRLFKRNKNVNEWGEDDFEVKEPFFKKIFKRKNKTDPIAEAQAEKNVNFQVIESEYFDGKKLNEREQKKIAKQVRKYNKQKPNKWEQNYLEMVKRGYPVHPDTARKYRNLAAKVRRQKDARTRKMNRIYRKTRYAVQGKRSDGTNVGKEMKAKNKETYKKQKQRARRLKRRQRTGYYLPFYTRWFNSLQKKFKKKE